jgi:hypothetical protein
LLFPLSLLLLTTRFYDRDYYPQGSLVIPRDLWDILVTRHRGYHHHSRRAVLVLPKSAYMLLPLFGDAAPHEIFSLLAYHPRDLDASVLSISTDPDPPTHVVDSNRPPVCATLGDLDTLPIELLDEVLQYSDLRTVSMLRLLNWRARVVVDASVPCRHILLRAPGVVTALGRTGVASHFSVSEVFYALSTPTCQVCAKFGSFLWIPECIRCCFSYLREAPELMPMGKGDARAAFGLTKRRLAKVPIMVTLPGTYTPSKIPYRKKRHLLSREKARQAAIVAHGGEEGLTRYINCGISQAKIKYDRRVAARNRTREAFDSQGRINITVDDITRLMATVPLPYFDPSSRTMHVGLACRGCEFELERTSEQTLSFHQHNALADQRDQTYTEEGILEHFKGCPGAQALWSARRNSRSSGQ